MQRPKHKKDYNHAKQGWIAGNPRYGKNNGYQKGQRAAHKKSIRVTIHKGETNEIL